MRVSADETDVYQQQQKDAAKVPGAPAQTGDASDGRGCGDFDHHRVVLHFGELEKTRGGGEDDQGGVDT